MKRRNARPRSGPKKTVSVSSSEDISDDEVSEDFIKPSSKRTKIKSTIPRSPEAHQWIDKYAPQRLEDVCINPRKLKEVREIIKNMLSGADKTRLLVFSGPSGSAKSTTAQLLANEMIVANSGAGLESYMDTSTSGGVVAAKWVEYRDFLVSDTPKPLQFSGFLQECKYRVGTNLSAVIIEELPNVFHEETLNNFRNAISDWIFTDSAYSLPPLILCISEVEMEDTKQQAHFSIENNFSVDTLFGKDLLNNNQGRIKVVRFNAVAKTFLKKTLNKVIRLEKRHFSQINQAEIDRVVSYAMESGDIRSAISNLQFWLTLNRNNGAEKDYNFLRENQISLFHAIGKVVYSSSKFGDLSDKNESDYLSIEDVLSSYGSNNSLLTLSILENYQVYNDLNYDVSIAGNIVNDLSINDILFNMDEGKEVGIRSTRFQLRNVQRLESANKRTLVKFPRHFKMLKEFRRTDKEIRQYQRHISENRNSFSNINLIDGYYLPLIFNSRKYKAKNGEKRYAYGRVGGPFSQILAEEALPVADEEAPEYIRDQFQYDIYEKTNKAEEPDDDNDNLSDPVEDSDEEDDFNDSLDGTLIDQLVSQSRMGEQTKQKENTKSQEDEFLDDPELDLLVSQGRI